MLAMPFFFFLHLAGFKNKMWYREYLKFIIYIIFYFYKLFGRKFKNPISLYSESTVWAYNFRTDKIIYKSNKDLPWTCIGGKEIFPPVFFSEKKLPSSSSPQRKHK